MADATVTAGRGVIYIALAKLYFMVAGYAIYFSLPRLLGSEVLWGNYLLVVGLVSIIDNVIVTGTIQGVSKFTAQDDARADGVKRAALRVQLVLGGGLAALYIGAAPFIASWERDPSLTSLYRISAGIMVCYSFYAVFVGSLNGLRHFGRQASLDVSFATLRAILILGAAAAGWGVAGAIGGFVSAAFVILVVSVVVVRLPRGEGRFPARAIWMFMLQLFVYTFALNMIMRVDLFLLKRLVGELSTVTEALARAELASAFSGYYGTAQSLAFIPYQAILAVAFVIFPLVSRSTFEKDLTTTQAYVRQTLRLSLIFVVGVAVVFMANPEAVIAVPYPAKYRIGGAALRILSAGMVCFSMFTIINTILNGAGRTHLTIISGGVTFGLAAVSNWLLIPRAATPEAALVWAACASSGSMAFGMVLSAVLLHREFKAGFAPVSLLRTAVALVAMLGLGHVIPEVSKLVTLGECILVFVGFFVVLAVTREFKAEDVAKLKRVLSRGR